MEPTRNEINSEAVPTPDGRTLGVARWGDPEGAPIVWLHGMPGSRGLRHVGDGYLTHRLCVYIYDRPGYGRSTRMPGRRVADVAADVRAIAEAVGLDRFAVGGSRPAHRRRWRQQHSSLTG